MNKFTINLFLYSENHNFEQYKKLDSFMISHGFKKTIKSDNGKSFDLPLGLYVFDADIDKSEVLSKTQAAISLVDPTCGIFITESRSRTWHNLIQSQSS